MGPSSMIGAREATLQGLPLFQRLQCSMAWWEPRATPQGLEVIRVGVTPTSLVEVPSSSVNYSGRKVSSRHCLGLKHHGGLLGSWSSEVGAWGRGLKTPYPMVCFVKRGRRLHQTQVNCRLQRVELPLFNSKVCIGQHATYFALSQKTLVGKNRF